jgi:hypothetical protein
LDALIAYLAKLFRLFDVVLPGLKSPVIRSIIMTSNDTIPPDAILNPYTPLAFLTPDAADQYQVMLYVYVALLAVSLLQFQAKIDLTSYLTGLHMGLAYGDSGGVQNYSKGGI